MTEGRGTGSVYSESFPNWGLMLGGEFIAQPTPGHPISGNGGGSWPTPAASSGGTHTGISAETARNELARGNQIGLGAAAALWPTPRAGKTTDEEEGSWRARNEDGKVATPPLGLAVKMHHIPTPTTADVYTGNMKSTQQSDGSMHSVSLPDYVEMFPTPSTMDHIERKGMRPSRAATNRTTGYLSEEVVRWATPTARDYKDTAVEEGQRNWPSPRTRGLLGGNGSREMVQQKVESGELTEEEAVAILGVKLWAIPTGQDAKNTAGPGREKRHGPMLNLQVNKWPTPTGDDANNVTRASGDFQSLSREVEGSLNPDWVEQHLMSLPEGWTRLEPVPDKAYDEWFDAMRDGTWWDTERGLPRVTTGAENRVNRLKMLGNGIVPATLALFLIDD